ncbi:hypothetical protein I4U23_031147 [Adineta vaga]|nr:hypothetical protein I4U23_031147 [Adineta vaga]
MNTNQQVLSSTIGSSRRGPPTNIFNDILFFIVMYMNNPEENPTAATTNVLKVTDVDKLVQRGENLDAMNNRADDLFSTSYHFRGAARQMNRNMRWKNIK